MTIDTTASTAMRDLMTLAIQLSSQANERRWRSDEALLSREFTSKQTSLASAAEEFQYLRARKDTLEDSMRGYKLPYEQTKAGKDMINGTLETYTEGSSSLLTQIGQLTEQLALIADARTFAESRADKYGALIEADKDEAWKDFIIEGTLGMKEGELVGTDEMALFLKALEEDSPETLEKLKDENYRTSLLRNLTSTAEAIKLQSLETAQVLAASKIGNERYVSNITNAITTAETYSGISAIRSIEADISKYPDEKDVPTKEATILTSKLNIGREYQYLITGVLPVETIETAKEATKDMWNSIYSRMSLDLTAAKPQYATGGYGSTMGNQKNYNDTLSQVYLNYQSKLQSDPEEASIFAVKTLQYFGVDLTDPSVMEELNIQDNIDNIQSNNEAFSALTDLNNLTNDPLNAAAIDSLDQIPGVGLDKFKSDYFAQLDVGVESDKILKQHKKDYPILAPVRLSEIYTNAYERGELSQYVESRLPEIQKSLNILDTTVVRATLPETGEPDMSGAPSEKIGLHEMYLSSPYLQSLDISYMEIESEWIRAGAPDVGDFLIDMFPNIEPEIIR